MSDFPYATVLVRGDDAETFLQGQLTVDLRACADADRILSAWCNPKGRVICLMRITAIDGGYGLTLPAELAAQIVERMTVFRFRAKVDFELRRATPEELAIDTPVADWQLEQLRAGVPEILADQSEKFTPHMLNLDLLGAISFDKGCYTGQEVVARTHYRGATKRRTLRFTAADPVAPGAKVSDGQREVGEVLNAIGTDLLAVLPLDKADTRLNVNGVALERKPLPYL